jgi:RND family efflux transporter MFP subunit
MRIFIRILQGVLPLVLLGLAGLAAMTMIRNRPAVETQAPQIAPPGVRVHTVELEDLDLTVVSEGTVRPRTESELVPEISGRVTSIAPSFAEGGFFEEGDVLVTIDPFDYQQAVVSARAQLAQTRLRLAEEEAEAEVALREWEDLGRGDPRELTLRKPQLEDARAAVAAAEANVTRAERDLERAEITAPYAGRVRRKNVDVGQFVTIGSSIGTIYAVDVAEIRLPMPDEELAYLNLPLSYRGSTDRRTPHVTVRTTFAGEEYTWDGRIVRTESEIDPVSRMVHVVAEVRDPYRAGPDPNRPPLAVGMYVDAEIEGRRFEQIAAVPRAALRGRREVIVVDDENRLHFQEIDVLRTTAQYIYVENGLENGQRVVISTIDSPTDGMLVQVTGEPERRLARRESETPEPTPPQPTMPNVADGQSEPRRTAAAQTPPTSPERRPAEPQPTRPAVPTPRLITTQSTTAATNAVAVLPFTDLSQQAAEAGVGAALSHFVAERLNGIDAVSVVPTATTASWVVGGTVQQQDDAVRVTIRVVATDEGSIVDTIWVDGAAAEISRIQNDVASAIAASLGGSIGITVPPPAADATPMPAAAPVARAAPDPPPPPAPAVTAVAVRPFANLSQAPQDDTLALEIGAAVAAHLTTGETLTVVASEDDAEWIVAGGIQRVGDTVRITARLVDVREGAVVRAVKIDGPVTDLMRLQDEVASAMRQGLREAVSVPL